MPASWRIKVLLSCLKMDGIEESDFCKAAENGTMWNSQNPNFVENANNSSQFLPVVFAGRKYHLLADVLKENYVSYISAMFSAQIRLTPQHVVSFQASLLEIMRKSLVACGYVGDFDLMLLTRGAKGKEYAYSFRYWCTIAHSEVCWHATDVSHCHAISSQRSIAEQTTFRKSVQ